MSHGPVRQEVIFAMAGSALAPLKLGLIKGIFHWISDGISYGMIFIQYGFIPSGVIKHWHEKSAHPPFSFDVPSPEVDLCGVSSSILLAATLSRHLRRPCVVKPPGTKRALSPWYGAFWSVWDDMRWWDDWWTCTVTLIYSLLLNFHNRNIKNQVGCPISPKI